MSRMLLDCNVISELRKKTTCDSAVLQWYIAKPPSALFISVLTLGEIRVGISRLEQRDRHQAKKLEVWLDKLGADYADRLLPVTLAIADRWGRLAPQQPLPAIDGLLAATALEHDLTLVTRNLKDFERSGVRLLNPFT